MSTETLSPSSAEAQDQPESNNEQLTAELEAMLQPSPESQGPDAQIEGLQEQFFPAADLDPAIANDPELSQEAGKIAEHVNAMTEQVRVKVGERLGTNEGGWYEDPATGERDYVKIYERPDQARAEVVANKVYEKLGIPAARSELTEIEGRLAVASAEIPGAQGTRADEQQASAEVRGGFVADAYLANWDVVGLANDNIVKDEAGHMVRVDNGGSLDFRAQGQPKEFSANSVPELDSMRDPEVNYSTANVFADLTRAEMRGQAKNLVENLSPDDIKGIVAESGMTGDQAANTEASLLGRREYLIDHFNLNEVLETPKEPGARIGRAIERFDAQSERSAELGLRNHEAIIADGDHIENQQIDLIDTRAEGHMLATFKLTADQYDAVQQRFAAMAERGEAAKGGIAYDSATGETGDYPVASAWEVQHGNVKIKVARAYREHTETKGNGSEVRAALGLVQIELPAAQDEAVDAAAMEAQLNDALFNVIGVPEGITEPTPEAAAAYKEARYRWHHKLDGELTPEQAEAITRLERREVMPGYSTMVEPGKAESYEAKYGEAAVYHNIASENAVDIFKTGGLLSSHERFRRGMLRQGMSTNADFYEGGADSVYTRIVTEPGVTGDHPDVSIGDVTLVMKPQILDRTDYYAYSEDRYGTTGEGFEDRKSPDEVFAEQAESGYPPGNEQLFRTGIGMEDVAGIACLDRPEVRGVLLSSLSDTGTVIDADEMAAAWDSGPAAVMQLLSERGVSEVNGQSVSEALAADPRMQVIMDLQQAGIHEVNGVAIEKFIVSAKQASDLIDIAHDRPPRSATTEEPEIDYSNYYNYEMPDA